MFALQNDLLPVECEKKLNKGKKRKGKETYDKTATHNQKDKDKIFILTIVRFCKCNSNKHLSREQLIILLFKFEI